MSERIEKSWGYEQIIANGAYCMKLLVYTKPIASSLHFHERKCESFYVASGEFEIEVGRYELAMAGDGMIAAEPIRSVQKMPPGSAINLEPGTHHRVRCLRPGIIVEASTHDDPLDCVRLEPSET